MILSALVGPAHAGRGLLRARLARDDVLDDVQDLAGALLEQDDVAGHHHPPDVVRGLGQLLVERLRQRLNFFLQAGRQRTVLFQMALQSGGKLLALGQARRQPLQVLVVAEPVADGLLVLLAEGAAVLGGFFALLVFFLFFLVLAGVLGLAGFSRFALIGGLTLVGRFALALALRGPGRRREYESQRHQQRPKNLSHRDTPHRAGGLRWSLPRSLGVRPLYSSGMPEATGRPPGESS